MNRQEQKAEIRSSILSKRDRIEPVRRIEMSLSASDYAAENIKFAPETIISGFFPIRSEIDPRPLMDIFRQRGARICLPIVADKTTILFRELVRGGELIDTGFGTRGPGPDAKVLDPQILIMPLSAFDKHGGRIGYGAGHYDRAISRLLERDISPRLFGFAYSCQEVDEVPVEDHDMPLEAIITETGFHPAVKLG